MHSLARACILVHSCTHSVSHWHVHLITRTHSLAHWHVRTHLCTYTRFTHSHARTRSHIFSHSRTLIHSPIVAHTFTLYFVFCVRSTQYREDKSYEEHLKADMGFNNPRSVETLIDMLGIDEREPCSLLRTFQR